MRVPRLPGSRVMFLLIFLVCSSMIAVGLYMQYRLYLQPCPLCITQRVFIVLAGLTGLIAALHAPGRRGRYVYGALVVALASGGGSFSIRQLWLQSLPADRVPACGPGLDYLMQTLPLNEVLSVLFSGDGNCAEVAWSFLGLSIPGWALVGFLLIAAGGAATWLERET